MKKPVVLVVDDEPQILRVMRASLPIRGYEVLTASTGEEALNQLSKQVPDLVILDLAMPEMSGLEVCRRVREFSSVPIIILSAKNREPWIRPEIEQRVWAYLGGSAREKGNESGHSRRH